MNHLVVAVSLDSSLELLTPYADIITLDKEFTVSANAFYDTVYIRSHFSTPSATPQAFRDEIEELVKSTKSVNQNVKFIDNMSSVNAIVAFEDKWSQYQMFSSFMPETVLYTDELGASSFAHPIYKKRLSSRGSDVTWDVNKVSGSNTEWIIQESLNIKEELRVYVIRNEIYPICAIKRSMTDSHTARSVDTRQLMTDEIKYVLKVMKCAPELDMVGIDMARTVSGELKVLETNRSPGFAKFHELTGYNLADELYKSWVLI